MFKKLRVKFIAVIMASVAVVLAVVFTSVCYSEYQRSMNSVNSSLETSIGRAIDQDQHAAASNAAANAPFDAVESASSSSSDFEFPPAGENPQAAQTQGREYERRSENYNGPRIGGRGDDAGNLVPVAVYRVNADGTLSSIQSVTTAFISDSVADQAAAQIAQANDGAGTLSDLGLHYLKRGTDTASYVAFVDISATSGWQSLALRLLIAGIATLGVFFVISLFFSNWALQPVKDAWESQRQFVADASHELKTPLTVILANTSILLKHPQNTIASQSQWIESTQIEANSMQELVGEMLELAQVEERASIQHLPLDFSDLVDGVSLQFESVAFERGCNFFTNIAEGLEVDGDASRLRKMVSTLTENALKYVDPNGAVLVKLDARNNSARLQIRNSGSTIAAEDLPHIFDRFYRTDKARTSGAGGFGLGLAIARETAREHGGDITCTSNENDGTTFEVTLPLIIVK